MIKNILIVDYKTQVLAVAAKMLRHHNLKVNAASSGSAALLKMARKDKDYGLLIRDSLIIPLPNRSGWMNYQ